MIELPVTALLSKAGGYVYVRVACPRRLFEALTEACDGDDSRALRELSQRWATILERLEIGVRDGTVHEFVTTPRRG